MSDDITDLRHEDDQSLFSRLAPQLERLETLRLAKLKIYEFRKKLAIPLVLVLTPLCGWIDWWLLMLQRGNDDSGAGVTFAVLGGLYWWVSQPKRQYAAAYKKDVLPHIAKSLGNLIYRIDGKIDMAKMQPSRIVPSFDKYKSEDYFEGTYKGTRLEFSEIKLTETRGSGKNRRTVTTFKGLALLIDMTKTKKKFLGHTILTKDQNSLMEWFKEKSLKMDRADLVDPEFEKLFDVYTSDQVEARYLIDPVMIERLKGLYEEYEGNKLSAACYDSKMLIMIASKHNHFEPAGLSIPAADPEGLLNMKRELGQILSVIDYLDLYDPAAVRGEAAVFGERSKIDGVIRAR